MKVSRPLTVRLPAWRVLFVESVHASDFKMAERTDPFHKVVYVLAGKATLRDGERATSLGAGDVVLVPAISRHALVDRAPATLLLLCLAPEFVTEDGELRELWRMLMASERRWRLSAPSRHRLHGTWRRALLEQANQAAGAGASVRSLAAQILVTLARMPVRAVGSDANARVLAVAREIEDSFYEEWTLDRAAARAGLSRRRFSELFRTVKCTTFWDALNRSRLKHAAELLRAGEHSITGVMFSCGFNDVSHFYRMFRDAYGAPPKAWASRNRVLRNAPVRT